MSRYNQQTVAGGGKERCSSCELLNILSKSKVGQKRCKACVSKENLRKMKTKHIPVHLRQRTLPEQTEKASRVLAEELDKKEMEYGEHDGRSMVSASRAPRHQRHNPDADEPVSLRDILELTFELLDLVESHVGRVGNREDVKRFQEQIRVLRAGRDRTSRTLGHVEDKRAILLAFSIFTEHYTHTIRQVDALLKKNDTLKQLAYDTAGLVKKSEAQFEAYVQQLKNVQGNKVEEGHVHKIQVTKLKNELTTLKLELNLRTNELREAQLENNALQEQLKREREKAEEMRKDKDHRITSLLAQLQQYSLDYSHEKSERLRLERENDRLWSDRMAYRSEQIRSKHLSSSERTRAMEREAIEKREWMEWKKKSAMRELQNKEKIRQEAWQVRQSIEQDAMNQLAQVRKELGLSEEAVEASAQRTAGRLQEKQEREHQQARADADRAARDREYWMELEQVPRPSAGGVSFPPDLSPISSPTEATVNAQRWAARQSHLAAESEVDAMIEQLRAKNQELHARTAHTNEPAAPATAAPAPSFSPSFPEAPATDVIRAGSYHGGTEHVFNNPRHSPAMPYFQPSSAAQPPSYNYTSTQTGPSAVAYQPMSVASSVPPPVGSQRQAHTASTQPAAVSAEDRAAVEREMEQLQGWLGGASLSASVPARSSSSRPSSSSLAPDYDAIAAGLRRSRAIRGESTHVYNSSLPLSGEEERAEAADKYAADAAEVRSNSRGQVSVEDEDESEAERERRREKQRRKERRQARARRSEAADSDSRSSSPSPSTRRPRRRSSDHKADEKRSEARSRREADIDIRVHSFSAEEASEEEPSARSTATHSRTSSRGGKEKLTVNGREAVPVRQLTLYQLQK